MNFGLPRFSRRQGVFWCAISAVIFSAGQVRAEMELLFREMFATSGQIDEVNPGENFSQVRGTLFQRAGGPRLLQGSAASADVRAESPSARGTVFFPSGGDRIFICGWFFFKTLQDHGARILSIISEELEPGPCLSIENDLIGGGVAYNVRTVLNEPAEHRWIFLGLALSRESGRNGSARYYVKFPGEPMHVWGGIDHAAVGIGDVYGAMFGADTVNSTIKCRMGAPSAYRFENYDFSDIVYPPDLIEPETGLTWFCNPATGDDANDGTAPDRAWAGLAKLNEESRHTGILSANSSEEGDTLIIDTSAAPLDALGSSWIIETPGLKVRAAPGTEWVRVKSHRDLASDLWQLSGIPNVYITADTQSDIVVWEDDKFLHHPHGSNLASIQASLASTPGSFWTDGSLLYLHPFGSTDPRSDGKHYERSCVLSADSAVVLQASNLDIRDLHVGKTCLARATDGDSIGAYCLATNSPLGNTTISHCYFYYGSKHNIGITTGGPGDDVLVEDVQCEQGSPYGGPGGQTLFVSFNHQPLPLGIVHRYHRCRTIANAGLIGSSEGEMSSLFPVFYAHNLGSPGEPDQFELFEFVDCDFGTGAVFGAAAGRVRFLRSTFSDLYFESNVEIDQCRVVGPLKGNGDHSLTIRNSLIKRSGMLTATAVAGQLTIEGCNIDASGVTSIQGGVPQASLFTRSGPLDVIFRNNAVVMPDAAVGANLFGLLTHSEGNVFQNNAYRLGGNKLVYNFNTGNGVVTPSLAQWKTLGYDAGSFAMPGLVLVEEPPGLDSPLLDAGTELSPAGDFTGQRLLRRNDIGAFEGPPTRFDEWQFAAFTDEELLQNGISGPDGSLFGDEVPNLMKYGLGLPARSPAQANVFQFKKTAGNATSIEFTRSLAPIDLEWVLERSIDLQIWEEVTNPAIQILSTGASTESVRLTLPAGTGTRFYRVRLRVVVP